MNLILATFLLTVNLTYNRCLRSWFQDLILNEFQVMEGVIYRHDLWTLWSCTFLLMDPALFLICLCTLPFYDHPSCSLNVSAHKASFIRTTISFSKTVTILAFKQNVSRQFTRYEAHICFHWCEWAKHWPKGAISQWLHKFVPKYYLNTAFQAPVRANAGTEMFSF